jgi:cytochrome P450
MIPLATYWSGGRGLLYTAGMSSSDAFPPAPQGWFGWNALETDLRDAPFPALNRLRDQHPVHQTPLGNYRILRHADVVHVLRELKVGMRTTEGVLPGIDESVLPRRFMLLQDPPDHERLRRLVSRAFTPPSIERMRSHVQQLVDSMLDAAEARGEIDVIADLARPLPSTIICQMLGVPVEDRSKFTDWTAHVTHLLLPKLMNESVAKRAYEAAMSLAQYMQALIDQRRSTPGADMLTVLIRAEADGDKLSPEELVTQCIGLLVAGFETTIGLIGNGVRQLLLHPAELKKLQERPELINSTVEECLRYDGPIPATRRVLHEDAVIGGFAIPKDSELMLSLAAAQRDPRVHREPDRFDIERAPTQQLAFGGGIHFCLGAHLARLESQIAIGSLIRRFPKLSLQSEKAVWGESVFRVLGSLPLRIET